MAPSGEANLMEEKVSPVFRREPTSAELGLARKMVREGKFLAEIHAALGWPISPDAVFTRLRKYGIPVLLKKRNRAHFGDETSINPKEKIEY